MKSFLIAPAVAVLFGCCLAFVFPVRPAIAEVTWGPASCAGAVQQIGDGYGCIIPLKVRPPGHGAGSNPDDWGMCGVLNFSGTFSAESHVRIIVDSTGYYGFELVGGTLPTEPTGAWTCVLFRDFKGAPPDSDATSSGPPFPSYNGGSKSGSEVIKGSAENACIWAGFIGNLDSPITGGVGAYGTAGAAVNGKETTLWSWYVTTYAICSGYSSASWKGWNYFKNGLYYAKNGPLGIKTTQDWCYMDYIQNELASAFPINVGLTVSASGEYSLSDNPPEETVSFNCLPLTQ